MATLSPIRYEEIKNCKTCEQGFFPGLTTPKNCFHIFCKACIDSILQQPQAQHKCPLCRANILNAKDTSQLPTYFKIFASYILKKDPRIEGIMKRTDPQEVNCSVCMHKEALFQPIFFHAGRFWHAECVPEEVDVTTATGYFPSQIVEIARTLDPPPSLKPVLAFALVLSLFAYIASRMSFERENPVLFALGFPFYLLSKILYLGASALKSALSEVQ
ncbi:MAG TPA: hypothetical protein PKW79_01060 [Rhabdochlamydiaceae bacterium]|nr:hypothetical protein [Rhabdochlamydiaceae bacterium]